MTHQGPEPRKKTTPTPSLPPLADSVYREISQTPRLQKLLGKPVEHDDRKLAQALYDRGWEMLHERMGDRLLLFTLGELAEGTGVMMPGMAAHYEQLDGID